MPRTLTVAGVYRSFYNYKEKMLQLQGFCVAQLRCATYQHVDNDQFDRRGTSW
jgi:hypothetical protein